MARDVSWRVPKRRVFSAPVPIETRTYKPVSHRKLAKITVEAIESAGFELGVEEYYTAKEGNVATARYTINDIRDADMQLEIGWQNSYDKTLSLKFAIGTRIMICENGCVSGNFGSFAKKHMADIQTYAPAEIATSIINASVVFEKMVEEKELMKRHIIGKEKQYEIAGKLFFMNPDVGSTQLNIINNELKHPSHDYGAPESIWEVYQYVTFAMKELHPRLWMDAHINVHKFFLNEVDRHTHKLEIHDQAKKWLNTLSFPLKPEEAIDPAQISMIDVIGEEEIKAKEE